MPDLSQAGPVRDNRPDPSLSELALQVGNLLAPEALLFARLSERDLFPCQNKELSIRKIVLNLY
jgi:hypothetical protein